MAMADDSEFTQDELITLLETHKVMRNGKCFECSISPAGRTNKISTDFPCLVVRFADSIVRSRVVINDAQEIIDKATKDLRLVLRALNND